MEEIKTKSKKIVLLKIVVMIIAVICLLSRGHKVNALGYSDLMSGRYYCIEHGGPLWDNTSGVTTTPSNYKWNPQHDWAYYYDENGRIKRDNNGNAMWYYIGGYEEAPASGNVTNNYVTRSVNVTLRGDNPMVGILKALQGGGYTSSSQQALAWSVQGQLKSLTSDTNLRTASISDNKNQLDENKNTEVIEGKKSKKLLAGLWNFLGNVSFPVNGNKNISILSLKNQIKYLVDNNNNNNNNGTDSQGTSGVGNGVDARDLNPEEANAIEEFNVNNEAWITIGNGMAGTTINTENMKIGPVSIDYCTSEGDSGEAFIEKVELYDIDGNALDFTIEDSRGNQISPTTIGPCKDGKTYTQVPINRNEIYYFINKTDKQAAKIVIKVHKISAEYNVLYTIYDGQSGTIPITTSTGGSSTGYIDGYSPQDLMEPPTIIPRYYSTEAYITINLKIKKGTLDVEKIGVDDAGNTEKLKNIKFKVYCGAPINKWVKSNTVDKLEWTDDVKSAKIFKTNDEGKLTIKHLFASQDVGSEKYIYEYKLVECEENKEEHPYYQDPVVISATESTIDTNVSVDTSVKTGDRAKYGINGVTAFYGKINNIKITDTKTSKDIIIEKKDKEFGTPLPGIEFKVKLVEAKYYTGNPYEKKTNLWLKNPFGENGSGVYDFKNVLSKDYLTDKEEEAGIFKTNAAGKIEIKCVIDGEYQTYETKSIDWYDLEIQENYDKNHKYRICEKIPAKNTTSEVTILNEKTRGSLSVRKIGEHKEILDKVQFAVYCEGTKYGEERNSTNKYTGWLTGNLDYSNVKWPEIGEIFKGDPQKEENRYKTKDGIFEIKGLPLGTYTIYEVINGEDYYDPEGQPGYNKDTKLVKLDSYEVKATTDNKPIEIKDLGNTSTRGNFELIKFLSNKETGAADVELEIYVEDTVTGAKYWLSPIGDKEGEYDYRGLDYDSIPKEGGIFHVDEKGKITVKCVPIGNYYIYEKRTDDIEYALEDQGYEPEHFDEQNARTLIEMIDVTKKVNEDNPDHREKIQKERPQGDLEIYKKGHYGNNGQESYEALKDVSFIVSSTAVDKGGLKTAEQKWVFINKNRLGEDIIDFTDDKEKATRFTTGEDGKIVINNLYVDLGPYTLEEVENKNPYYNDIIVVNGSLKDIAIIEGQKTGKEIDNERSSGDLDIIKVDSEYSGNNGTQKLGLQGAEFKIRITSGEYVSASGMWLKSIGGYDYSNVQHEEYLTSDLGSAGTFVSGSDGEIHIKRIINGTYEIWESKAPDGYDLTKQTGYDSSLGMAKVATISIKTLNNNTVKVTITNTKTVVQLDGHVWEDVPGNKANNYNEIQDNYEKQINGITVELYDKKKQKVIARTTTDGNGYYSFTYKNVEGYEPVNATNTYNSPETDPRITYWELANCYVRFIYDNIGTHDDNGFIKDEKYGYVTVDPFVGNDITRNSKAKEYTINQEKLEEENLTGINTPNPGIAITKPGPDNTDSYVNFANYEEIKAYESRPAQDKLLPGFYNNSDYTIHNINLGLKAKPTTDFAVTQEIAYTKVQFGQYTYKYEYMSENEQIVETVPAVHQQNSARTFTSAIYPSDVAYNKANNVDELKVYVIYRIAVQNNTTTTIPNSYMEDKMYLASLTNEYDPARYELSTDISDVDIAEVNRDVSLWSNEGTNTVKFDVNNENNPYYSGIAPLETKTSYLQYRLTESSVEKILAKKLTAEDIVQAPSLTTVRTFHEFFRNDNLWVQSSDKQYRDHKQSSYEAKGEYLHKSWSQTRKTSELWMRFDLPKEERQISGIVFEDGVEKGTAELGNGKKEDSESTVSKVQVELLSSKDNNRAITLYQYAESEAENYKKVPAVTTVDVGGTYTFKGIIPGYYYLRFTYGNGDVKYTDLDGNEITNPITSKIDNGNKDVSTNDYKSTIITSDVIKEALESADDDTANSNAEWYKKLDAENYSTAIDNMAQRANNSNQTYKENNMPNPEPVIDAYTAKTSITIENSNENVANIKDVQYEDNTGIHKTGSYCEYNGFNFGIVTMPKTDLKLDKKIVNVDYTVSGGEQLVSANPKNNTSMYLTALDNITGGSRYAKVELDSNLIYGSKIDITYEVEVKNDSTPFFTNEDYSKYGNVDPNAPARVTVTVQDLLDEKYDYDTVKLISDKVIKAGSSAPIDSSKNVTISTEQDGTRKYKEITDWDALATGEIETIRYTASALLQLGIEDSSFVNDATIDTMTLDKYISLNTASTNPWNPDDVEETTTFVITPSTGEDRSNTYWIAGAIALIVLGAGIVVIKKRLTK